MSLVRKSCTNKSIKSSSTFLEKKKVIITSLLMQFQCSNCWLIVMQITFVMGNCTMKSKNNIEIGSNFNKVMLIFLTRTFAIQKIAHQFVWKWNIRILWSRDTDSTILRIDSVDNDSFLCIQNMVESVSLTYDLI